MAKRLRELRAASGLTQAEVAERIGVNRRTVWVWERGENVPTLHLPALAELYGTTSRFLLYGVDESSLELASLRHEVAHLHLQLTRSSDATAAALEALAGMLDDLIVRVDALRRDDPGE
jgi:transcriptional regulator with XRE-family HTH domain